MAFKMKNPFKQAEASISESTSVQKPVVPVVTKPKKCYMTDPTTGKKKEIPCTDIKGSSSRGTITSTTDANLKKMKGFSRGRKFIGLHG